MVILSFPSTLEVFGLLLRKSNQTWFNTSEAEGRFYGSFLNIRLIRSLAYSLIFYQHSYLNEMNPLYIELITSALFFPSNGGIPDKRTYKTTPHDQISTFSS